MLSSPLFSGFSALFIGADYSYEFCTDQVRLNAEICVSTPSGQPVSLQLWACDAPFNGGLLQGIKVAEIDCGVVTGDTRIDQTVPACLPAGTQAYAMELVLVEGDTILSHAGFNNSQLFVLPRLQGAVTLALGEASASIQVEQISNPRDADNVSGTLVLELWALSQAYTGGAFAGVQLGSAIQGVLAGQDSWRDSSVQLPLASRPVAGSQLVLMLREWTAAGYVTRDYRHLQSVTIPVEAEELPQVAPAVVKVEPAAPAKAVARKTPARQNKPVPVVANKTVDKVSVNTATLAQLIAEKGISKTVAEKLIAGRPYVNWQEVAKVKGVGEKSLAVLQEKFGV